MTSFIPASTPREWLFESQIDGLDVSVDGRLLCCASNLEGNQWDGSIHIINLNSDSDTPEISANSSAGCSLSKFIGNNQSKVITARDDGNIGLYSSANLSEIDMIKSHDDIVSCLTCDSNDCHKFFSASWDGYFFEYTIGKGRGEIVHEVEAHSGIIHDMAISSTFNLLCTVGHDGFARIWDTRSLMSGCTGIIALDQIGASVSWRAGSVNI